MKRQKETEATTIKESKATTRERKFNTSTLITINKTKDKKSKRNRLTDKSKNNREKNAKKTGSSRRGLTKRRSLLKKLQFSFSYKEAE